MPRFLLVVLAGLSLPAAVWSLPIQARLDQAPPLDPTTRFVPPGPPPGIDLPVSLSRSSMGPPFETPVGPPDGVPPTPEVPAHGNFPLDTVPPHPIPPFPVPVPEPGTALLLLAGLLGLRGLASTS